MKKDFLPRLQPIEISFGYNMEVTFQDIVAINIVSIYHAYYICALTITYILR